MSAPRSAGTHLPYAGVPDRVRAWVEQALGSPVVTAREQTGGMSPGCVTRLVCADGTRAFVKAVGAELNPDSPTLYRREALVLGLLGSHPLWADLLASYDEGDGGWVALLLEDVEGEHPDTDDDAVMDALLAATDDLGRVLRERVPDPPRPDPAPGVENPMYRPGLTDLGQVYPGWLRSYDVVAHERPDVVPAWVAARHDELRPLVVALTEVPCDHLVHYDIRNDNLLVRPSGEVVFVDWGAAAIGPAWQDALLARVERVDRPWFDTSVRSSPALAAAGDDLVTASMLAIGAHLALRAATVVDVGLPGLAAFRRTEARRFLGAAGRRLGEPPGRW
ncbi:phosphotransferase [Nocardioides litoris]|uniref:phosphotransferase n=1 Tax=Nocardioides litoris TaxID=1926648 RepID=UPI0011243A4B|nr:phosphotransferase [Nocardioides litoris]